MWPSDKTVWRAWGMRSTALRQNILCGQHAHSYLALHNGWVESIGEPLFTILSQLSVVSSRLGIFIICQFWSFLRQDCDFASVLAVLGPSVAVICIVLNYWGEHKWRILIRGIKLNCRLKIDCTIVSKQGWANFFNRRVIDRKPRDTSEPQNQFVLSHAVQ